MATGSPLELPSREHLIVGADRTLAWHDRRFPCALGAAGIRRDKREGDQATPAGRFALRRVLYRPDRLAPPRTRLAVAPLTPRDGWCDDVADPLYNQAIRQPFGGRHESLWRTDHVYDVIVVVGYNDNPVQVGRGSAIFVHVVRPSFAPTEGCVALRLADLLTILEGLDPHALLCVAPEEPPH